MPYFINKKDIEYSIRAKYLNEYKQKLKESLINPLLSQEDRSRIRELLFKIEQERGFERALS